MINKIKSDLLTIKNNIKLFTNYEQIENLFINFIKKYNPSSKELLFKNKINTISFDTLFYELINILILNCSYDNTYLLKILEEIIDLIFNFESDKYYSESEYYYRIKNNSIIDIPLSSYIKAPLKDTSLSYENSITLKGEYLLTLAGSYIQLCDFKNAIKLYKKIKDKYNCRSYSINSNIKRNFEQLFNNIDSTLNITTLEIIKIKYGIDSKILEKRIKEQDKASVTFRNELLEYCIKKLDTKELSYLKYDIFNTDNIPDNKLKERIIQLSLKVRNSIKRDIEVFFNKNKSSIEFKITKKIIDIDIKNNLEEFLELIYELYKINSPFYDSNMDIELLNYYAKIYLHKDDYQFYHKYTEVIDNFFNDKIVEISEKIGKTMTTQEELNLALKYLDSSNDLFSIQNDFSIKYKVFDNISGSNKKLYESNFIYQDNKDLLNVIFRKNLNNENGNKKILDLIATSQKIIDDFNNEIILADYTFLIATQTKTIERLIKEIILKYYGDKIYTFQNNQLKNEYTRQNNNIKQGAEYLSKNNKCRDLYQMKPIELGAVSLHLQYSLKDEQKDNCFKPATPLRPRYHTNNNYSFYQAFIQNVRNGYFHIDTLETHQEALYVSKLISYWLRRILNDFKFINENIDFVL